MKKSILALLIFVLLGAVTSVSLAQNRGAPGAGNLPGKETTLFAGSGVCARCHEGLFEDGIDVSPVTLWRSTMMANAAKDPLWRAKVSREVSEFPDLQAAIEEKCIKCHSPVLYKQSVFDGMPYSIANLENDRLARDGDTCTVCHQVLPDNFGIKESFSGDFMIWRDPPAALRTIFGPYPNPFAGPMVNNVNYTPVFAYPASDYSINDSEHCATCHNLFTNYVLQDGSLSTEKFPEQTPYYEWKNSDYFSSNTTCQGCHMPQTSTPIRISTVAPGPTRPRTPFWYHHFVGGNRFMPAVLQDNIDLLGVTATAAHFVTTLANTTELLQNNTIELTAKGSIVDSILNVDVTLTNKAGHKLPTGIPLRRVWIHLTVTDSSDTVIFESGAWDASGEIVDLDPDYEPHYDIIDDASEVQIYEGVMKDDWENVTRLLLRAKDFVKDNRLPPKGFSKDHADYKYIKIIGTAADDADFNADGSGADIVHYQIPIGASGGPFTVDIEVCYQTVTPGEVAHLTDYGTAETQLFNDLYTTADKSPVILKQFEIFDIDIAGN
jgi:hypothetical protein